MPPFVCIRTVYKPESKRNCRPSADWLSFYCLWSVRTTQLLSQNHPIHHEQYLRVSRGYTGLHQLTLPDQGGVEGGLPRHLGPRCSLKARSLRGPEDAVPRPVVWGMVVTLGQGHNWPKNTHTKKTNKPGKQLSKDFIAKTKKITENITLILFATQYCSSMYLQKRGWHCTTWCANPF